MTKGEYLGLQFAFFCCRLYNGAFWCDRRKWKLHAHGGGAPILFVGTQPEATAECAQKYGIVSHVDTRNAFVFFKPHNRE